jgi:transcriptional regulator with XRE-family HTH domain
MTDAVERAKARAERGERAKQIREALHMNGDQMAEAINQKAHELGLVVPAYDKTRVSRVETGAARLSGEEAVLWAAVDPKRRGVPWLVAGLPVERGSAPKHDSSHKKGRQA